MRHEPNLRIEQFRRPGPGEYDAITPPGVNWGFFIVHKWNSTLRIISSGTSEETGWEHVSVSLEHRCPTWDEMCFVKDLFWTEEETVVQFHPKRSEYVNDCEHCLHLWRPLGIEYVLPPKDLI